MRQLRVPATFMRGGTSKALVLHKRDLPSDETLWPALFRAMLGSPDRYGRQLNGMGGGLSSLSKICIVAPSKRHDADVDYTFAQVGVSTEDVDFSGNCGNMSSAIGPFAYDEGLVPATEDNHAIVRIHNTNTGKIIRSRFAVANGEAVVDGDFAMPGVDGTGAPVALSFLDPASTQGRGLLPTGRAQQALPGGDLGDVAATMVDAAVPTVFVNAVALFAGEMPAPASIDANPEALGRLEAIRRAASVAMGIAEDEQHAGRIIAIPKIAMVSSPSDYRTISGEAVKAESYDLRIQMISAGQAHRAVPITGALATAVAALVTDGTVAEARAAGARDDTLRLGTPSGLVEVGAEASHHGDEIGVKAAHVVRTQRRLMEGHVRVSHSTTSLTTGETNLA